MLQEKQRRHYEDHIIPLGYYPDQGAESYIWSVSYFQYPTIFIFIQLLFNSLHILTREEYRNRNILEMLSWDRNLWKAKFINLLDTEQPDFANGKHI